MITMKMKVLTASLLTAMTITSDAWAVSGESALSSTPTIVRKLPRVNLDQPRSTPNSTTTLHVKFLFDGQCYNNAFANAYSTAEWYPAYAEANANASVWGYLFTEINGEVTFKTTRRFTHGGVSQVDLASNLGAVTFDYGASYSSASSYNYAVADQWWTGSVGSSEASSYGSFFALDTSGTNSQTSVSTKGTNITEFKAHVALNASNFRQLDTSVATNAWSDAVAYAGWTNYPYTSASASAWADLISKSVLYMDITAHYERKPGLKDVQTLVATGYLTCGVNSTMYASTYAYAY